MLQNYPASDYEIIVVDNRSTDRTKEVVSEFSHVRYVLEEKMGLSHARNRGIKESRGDVVAFIDDDAKADKSWLSRLVQVYKEEKDAGCVGGRVILDWKCEKPSWWHTDLDEVFNGINYSDSRISLSHPRYPYGTNISFRTDIVEKAGGFQIRLFSWPGFFDKLVVFIYQNNLGLPVPCVFIFNKAIRNDNNPVAWLCPSCCSAV